MSIDEIAIKIRSARKNANMTQAEAAARLGITYQAISNYERGVTRIDTDTLVKLCSVYGIPVSDILGSSNTPPTAPCEENRPANIIRIAGRDGSFTEKRLTDDQLKAIKLIIDQMPDAEDI